MARTIAASRKAAKKKAARRPPPELEEEEEEEAELEVLPDEDAEAELAHVLAELGGLSDASISVNKVGLQGEERLGKFMPNEFDVDSLRDRYGGGTYWIYAHVGGKLKHKRRVVFARSLEEQRGESPRAPASSSSSASGEGIKDVLAEMARQQHEMLTLVLNTMTQQRAPAQSPMEIIDAATKLSNLGNRRNDVDVLLQGIKLARELDGGGGGDPGLAAVAMEFFRSMGAREPQAPQPQHQLTTGADHMMLIQRAIAQHLPTLIRGAQTPGSDPGVYAQLVLDQVPQLYLPALIDRLQQPDWFSLLVRIDGRVVPLQAWFEALRAELLQAVNEVPPETSSPAPPVD